MINVRLVVVYFYLILITLAACGQSPKDRCAEFNERYPEVISKLGKNPDTVILIRVLNEIINNDSKCIDAYLTRGDLLFQSDNLTKAKEDYRKALVLDTGNVYALYKLGLVFQDEDVYDSSIHFLDLAINKKTHKGYLVDFNQVGGVLSTDENKYDIESVELMYRQAVSFYYKNDFKSALKNFNFCIQNNYRLDKAFLYRGAIYLDANKKDQGCRDLLESKKYGNSDADTYLQKYCDTGSR